MLGKSEILLFPSHPRSTFFTISVINHPPLIRLRHVIRSGTQIVDNFTTPRVHETIKNKRRSSYEKHPPRKSLEQLILHSHQHDGDKSRGVANATWVGSFFSRENIKLFLLVEKHRSAASLCSAVRLPVLFCPNRALGLVLFLPEPLLI